MKIVPDKPPSELRSHIGFWMRMVSNHVSHAFAQKVAASGVTVAEWVILREMFERSGTAPSDLSEITGLTRGAVSKLAERLLAKKLLTRTYATDDRRFQNLTLTAAGRRIVPTLAALADRNDEEFFAALSTRERAILLASLRKLVHAHSLKISPTE